MSTPPAVKRWWVTNLRGAAGAAAAFSALLSPLGASSARTAVVETNRVKRMASVALRMRRISLMVSQIRLERAEVSGFRRAIEDATSAAARRLDCSDVDLCHLHHRIERALGNGGVGIG